MRDSACVILLALSCVPAFGQGVMSGVSVPVVGPGERVPARKSATISLDDAAQRLVVACSAAPLAIDYGAVQRVIVETDTSWHRPNFGALFAGFAAGGALLGPSIASRIDNPIEMDHVVLLEYKKPDGAAASYVFVASKATAPGLLRRLQAAFGERLILPSFPERAEVLGDTQFRNVPKFEVRGATAEHPRPETKPGQALVVVACPVIGGLRAVGTEKWSGWSGRLLLDGQPVAATGPGTYTFLHLQPGEHQLVSLGGCPGSCHDATRLRITVEPGGEYYMVHTVYVAGTVKSFLARHSKEIVMHDLQNLLWAEWRPRK